MWHLLDAEEPLSTRYVIDVSADGWMVRQVEERVRDRASIYVLINSDSNAK